MKKASLKIAEIFVQKLILKDEMKTIIGGVRVSDNPIGEESEALPLGASCNDNVQCASNNCASDPFDTKTGKTCQVSP